ncbi:MAG: serine protease, partial [Thiotrichales bacterium]|nr:serine protease [Thiotrichales bacterium]
GVASANSLPDTIDKVRPSIVAVGTHQPTRRPSSVFLATGFVVANGRYVITNAHVLPRTLDTERREILVVGNRGGEQAYEAELVAEDRVHDVALLRMKGAVLPALVLGDPTIVREGELYAFTGFPIGEALGLRPATHRGIIAAITPIATPQLSSSMLDADMVRLLRDPYNIFQLDATACRWQQRQPVVPPGHGGGHRRAKQGVRQKEQRESAQ